MRLLNTATRKVEELGSQIPPYAILSHVWGKKEVMLQDIGTEESKLSPGWKKIENACSVAARDGFEYIWIDTCCIDKTSSSELSEAINSMYRWYQEAGQCYAYLADVPHEILPEASPSFYESKWFTRGWTLQELIAPATVIFFDARWKEIGTKSNLHSVISDITGIPSSFLFGDDLGHASVAQRMSWASKRETTRVEDIAYCLMGLFGIYMPMLYGEGQRAFIRLQEEIMRVSDDHSIFAWRSTENHGGILATSPSAFTNSGNIISINPSYGASSPSTLNSRGVHLSLPYMNKDAEARKGLAVLHCTEIGKESMRLAIHLRSLIVPKEEFIRERNSTLELVSQEDIDPLQYPLTSIYIRQWHPTRNRKIGEFEKCAIKLQGIEGQEIGTRIKTIDLGSDWMLDNGLIITTSENIPDGVLGRLLIMCQDTNWFQVCLRKSGRFLSAGISTSAEPDSQTHQPSEIPEKEHQDHDQIGKALGDGAYVHIVIKKRILVLQEKSYLTSVVEISYSSNLRRMWLDHVAILESENIEDSILFHAAKRGLTSMAKPLLIKRRSYSMSNKDGRTLLSLAVEGAHSAMVELLLATHGNIVNRRNDGGHRMTPLTCAAAGGHTSIVRMLLAAGGVQCNWPDGEFVRTPLSWAAMNGHEEIVTLLLDADSVSHSPKEKKSYAPPFFAAFQSQNTQQPFEENTMLESMDSRGWTPLSLAAMNGHGAVVQLLLKRGSKIESADHNGLTPLFHAAMNGHTAVVEMLLKRIADIEAKNKSERTLVSLEARDKSGNTAVSLAAMNGHTAVVDLLLKSGASSHTVDYGFRTPLYLAKKSKSGTLVKLTSLLS